MEWLRVELNVNEKVLRLLEPGYGINPAACLVSIATTGLVMAGIRESKVNVIQCFFYFEHTKFIDTRISMQIS